MDNKMADLLVDLRADKLDCIAVVGTVDKMVPMMAGWLDTLTVD